MQLIRFRPTRRWSPAADFNALEKEFERLFKGWPVSCGEKEDGKPEAAVEWNPAIDIRETEEAYSVHVDLPGVKKDNIEVTVQDGTLILKGQRKSEHEEKSDGYHRVERWSGNFVRRLQLPKEVKADAITAAHQDGVLTVTVPKAEEVKPKQIQISVN